jgi:hypothetical protein
MYRRDSAWDRSILIPMFKCAIPAFEGLLDGEHNDCLMKLLYHSAEWHALAKLRMHTDPTLTRLDKLTIEYGRLMREFRDLTCANFDTVELPREVQARGRRQAQAAGLSDAGVQSSEKTAQRKPRKMNLLTYKFHALGDYVSTIRWFGTTDSYSTQIVCDTTTVHVVYSS